MILVTMGSDYFPKTAEGRFLTWLLALYGFAVFGYLTASVASFFVGRDQTAEGGEDDEVTNPALQRELSALRREIVGLRSDLERREGGGG